MSLNKSSLVTTRDFKQEDYNFILATWLRGLYYGDSWFKEIPKQLFMESYQKVIVALLNTPGLQVKVSCLKEDPDVILGYAVYKGSTLHWVYVKSNWRRIGIMKSLVPNYTTTITHLTKLGLSLLKRREGVVFNPFALS